MMDAMEEIRGADVERALSALWELQGGKSLSVADIQSLGGVSLGSARRTFKVLQTYPAVFLDEGSRPARLTYRDPALTSRPAARTTAILSSCLATSLSSLFSGLRYEAQMRSLRDTLVRHAGLRQEAEYLDRKFMFLAGGGDQAVATAAHVLDDVLEGILRSQELDVVYSDFGGDTTTSSIRPLSLIVHQHQLYVVAFHKGHQRYHPFRLARIRAVELSGRPFEYPGTAEYNPGSLFTDSFGIFVADRPPAKVRVRLAARWATYAQSHRWHPSQKTTVRRDGRVDVELRVITCPELLQWILGFGHEAEVLAPKILRERVHHVVRQMAKPYRNRTARTRPPNTALQRTKPR